MGYRKAETNLHVQVVHLHLNAAQRAHCAALRQEAGRCWTALLHAHLASRDGLWLGEAALKAQFKGQFPLHSQTVQALAEKLIANVDTARELRKTDPTAQYPYRDKLYQTVVWKQAAIRRAGPSLRLSNGRGHAPLVLPVPQQYATADICKCELTWRADHYELCLTLDTGVVNPPLDRHVKAAGVDLGEINIAAAVTDAGAGISINGRYLRSVNRLRNKRHTALNVRLKKCTPGSRRHKKLLRSKARASATFYRQSRDVLHKASRQLVTFAQAEGVAHLAVGDVRDVAQGIDKGRQHNQRMSQWAHGQFFAYVQDKARQHGITTEYLPEDYSTRTCSVCRHCHHTAPRGRVVTCAGCGAIVSRDGNGAANICSRYRYGAYGQVQVQALTYLRATAVVPRTRPRAVAPLALPCWPPSPPRPRDRPPPDRRVHAARRPGFHPVVTRIHRVPLPSFAIIGYAGPGIWNSIARWPERAARSRPGRPRQGAATTRSQVCFNLIRPSRVRSPRTARRLARPRPPPPDRSRRSYSPGCTVTGRPPTT